MDSDLTLGFVTDVYQDMVLVHGDDPAGDDFTLFESLETFLVHVHEVFHRFLGFRPILCR